MIVARRGIITVACSKDAEKCRFYYPADNDNDDIRICVDEHGKAYLAITAASANANLEYMVLVNLVTFYDTIVVDSMAERHWIVLYDAGSDLYLQNDMTQVQYRTMSAETALSRQDGCSAVTRAHILQETVIEQYVYQTDAGQTMRCEIVAMPESISRNGTFSVGIAFDIERIAGLVSGAARRTLVGAILIALDLAILIFALLQSNRRHRELQEEVAIYQQRAETVQQLLDAQKELARNQRLETVGVMTGAIAHEFNNLLTPIMGYSLMCLEQLPPELTEIADELTEIYGAAERAKIIVSRLSAITRKNSRQSRARFSPDDLVHRVMDIAMSSLPAHVDVRLELNCPEACLEANETQVGQAILNLILNAFHAMERTGGTLTLESRMDGDDVLLAVRDTGEGIAEDVLPRIFEPFFTTKEPGKGTGLGLAIVKQVMDTHGGSVSIESRAGEGTRCVLRFPAGGMNAAEE